MNKKLILLIAPSLLPTYASAAMLDLKQDLGGLDLVVAMEPPYSPQAIRVTNKSTKVVACTLTYTGANAGMGSTVTVKPGKSDTIRVKVDDSTATRSGNLECAEKKAASKK
jgi:hypothetical protein